MPHDIGPGAARRCCRLRFVRLMEREMASCDRSIEEAGVAFEEGLQALLDAYYDELRAALTAWRVPRELEEPAKLIFGVARRHAGREPGAVQAWGLKPWALVANCTPAELLRKPGGDLLILPAFDGC